MIGVYKNWDITIDNEVRYVFDTLLNTLGVSYIISSDYEELIKINPLVIINYGDKPLLPNTRDIIIVNIPCSKEFVSLRSILKSNLAKEESKNYLEEISTLENKFLGRILNKVIHLEEYLSSDEICFQKHIFSSQEEEEVAIIEISIDIIASTFHLLICQEQIFSLKRDFHEKRFSTYSMLYNYNLITKPLINIYIKLLQQIFLYCAKRKNQILIQKWYWPERENFAVCLTHDVDHIHKWKLWTRGIKEILAGGMKFKYQWIKNGILEVYNLLVYKNPYWDFDKIVKLEKQYGYLSSFYLLADNSTYKIKSKKLVNTIRKINEQGYEIGLHGSYNSCVSYDTLLSEKKIIEKILKHTVIGIRQHFLRFEPYITWQLYSKLGLKYDTSIGYPDQIGFRIGGGFPFYLYDIQQNKKLPTLELPLTIMDGTLFDYQKYSIDEAFNNVKIILETTKRYNGLAVLLWHHGVFDERYHPGWGKVYEMILDWLYNNNAYVCLGKDVTYWWEMRDSVRLIEERNEKDRREWKYVSNMPIKENFSFKLTNIMPEDINRIEMLNGIKFNIYPLSETECMLTTKQQSKEILIKVSKDLPEKK